MADPRKDLEELKSKTRVSFDDLETLVERIVASNPELFPSHELKQGEEYVAHHFHAGEVPPLVLKRPSSRPYLLPTFVKLAFQVLDDLIVFVEGQK